MRMFWWIMPSNQHIPAIKWLQEYGVSFCMGDKLPATELQVKRWGSMVLISGTITSVRIFIPCGIKKLLYQDKNCQFPLFCMPICSLNHSLTVKKSFSRALRCSFTLGKSLGSIHWRLEWRTNFCSSSSMQ